jgi:hypothetical protein
MPSLEDEVRTTRSGTHHTLNASGASSKAPVRRLRALAENQGSSTGETGNRRTSQWLKRVAVCLSVRCPNPIQVSDNAVFRRSEYTNCCGIRSLMRRYYVQADRRRLDFADARILATSFRMLSGSC